MKRFVSQRCPRCGSSRIRRGHRSTPLWWLLFARHRLLCDNCNWEFIGFALPWLPTLKGKGSATNLRRTPRMKEHKPTRATENLKPETPELNHNNQ